MYRRKCVDDTLLLSRLKDHMENIRNDLNPYHKIIKFTFDIETGNSILLLDMRIAMGVFILNQLSILSL